MVCFAQAACIHGNLLFQVRWSVVAGRFRRVALATALVTQEDTNVTSPNRSTFKLKMKCIILIEFVETVYK